MSDESLRRLRAQLGPVTTVAASDAKNQFGQVLDSALRDGAVVITKHDSPKAILISIDEFDAITQPRTKLDSLSAKFDEMVAAMQRPAAKNAVDKLLDATPKELGAAAVKAARRKAR
jgi:prevent-host-death family protein